VRRHEFVAVRCLLGYSGLLVMTILAIILPGDRRRLMRGSYRLVWVLGGALSMLATSTGAVRSANTTSTPNGYSWLSATQVVGLTASAAAHGPMFSPASAALTTGVSGLYGLSAASSAQSPLMNMLLVGVPIDTNDLPLDLQDAASTATGLGFGNNTGTSPLGGSQNRGGAGRGSKGAHHNAGTGGMGRGAGGSGGGGHHSSSSGSHRSPPPAPKGTSKGVPAKH
jgi:hypothetical protein